MSDPAPPRLAEFTFKAVVAGVVFGALFGAANAYLGLRVGLTVSTSIPIAVLSVALFRLMGRGTILEANLSQTIGSAASSLASGTIFTIPALFMWGMIPAYAQVALLALLGAYLGIFAMVPLRRLLIVQADRELPYPEGRACAELLRATQGGASGSRWIFIGFGVGASVYLLIHSASLLPKSLEGELGFLPKAVLALEVAPALLAVGYILGFKSASVMVSGSLLAAVVLVPLIAQFGRGLVPPGAKAIELMSAGELRLYIRYLGAGAVAAAGILTVLRTAPTMWASLAAVVRGLRTGGAGAATAERTDRDVPGGLVVGGVVAVVDVLALVPGIFAGGMSLGPRLVAALGVALFGMAFVAVSSRIVGLIGVSSNPTSAMALVTLLGTSSVFLLVGWNDPSARAAVLTVGTVVCVAASKAGDISQDLKTGQLVGATPSLQQYGQLIGAAIACWVVAGTVFVLHGSYKEEGGFGGPSMPAPQATLMRTVIEGVLTGTLPWGLISTGAALALTGALAGLPALSFAIGIYLPLGTLTPIFLGGLLRRFVEARRKGAVVQGDPGVLCASGLIAGEGIAGIAVAAQAWIQGKKPQAPPLVGGVPGELLAALLVVGVLLLVRQAARSRT
jgi:putative OPT family oligopeptide transporter